MITRIAQTQLPKVFIIILNWKNAPDTIECLESVFRLNSDRFQVIVCDNASSDNSIATISQWLSERNLSKTLLNESELDAIKSPLTTDIVIISNLQNCGYAGGNNRGLRYIFSVGDENDYLWIINNDTTLDAEALNSLLSEASKRSEVSFFGSTIMEFTNRDIIQTQGGDHYYPWLGLTRHIGGGLNLGHQHPQLNVERAMSYVSGAAVFVRLSAARRLGLMTEDYFLFFEEADWATRARRLGMKFGYASASLVYHKVGATVGTKVFTRRKSQLADYYGVKNRLIITKKFFTWALPTVYLVIFFTLLKRLITGQFDRAWMVMKIILNIDERPIRQN